MEGRVPDGREADGGSVKVKEVGELGQGKRHYLLSLRCAYQTGKSGQGQEVSAFQGLFLLFVVRTELGQEGETSLS